MSASDEPRGVKGETQSEQDARLKKRYPKMGGHASDKPRRRTPPEFIDADALDPTEDRDEPRGDAEYRQIGNTPEGFPKYERIDSDEPREQTRRAGKTKLVVREGKIVKESASDEPRECAKCGAAMSAGDIRALCAKCYPRASDEPREGVDAAAIMRDFFRGPIQIITPQERAEADARGLVWRHITPENAPVIAAVLAEVARLEADGVALLTPPPVPHTAEWQIHIAARAIAQALRLKAGGE